MLISGRVWQQLYHPFLIPIHYFNLLMSLFETFSFTNFNCITGESIVKLNLRGLQLGISSRDFFNSPFACTKGLSIPLLFILVGFLLFLLWMPLLLVLAYKKIRVQRVDYIYIYILLCTNVKYIFTLCVSVFSNIWNFQLWIFLWFIYFQQYICTCTSFQFCF